jgi:hypothetical protein
MRIPSDATIDETKFTDYLLVQRPWDDKSGYLRRAGFELKDWPDLRAAIRRLADARRDRGPLERIRHVLSGRGNTRRPDRESAGRVHLD